MQKLILKNANKNRWAPSTGAQTISMYWTLTGALDAFSCRRRRRKGGVVLDNDGAQLSTIDPQSWLFMDTRAGNDGFRKT